MRNQSDLFSQPGGDGAPAVKVDVIRECRSFAVSHALKKQQVCSDDVRFWADARGLSPSHPNAWGRIFSKPPEGFEWHMIGWRKSVYPSSNRRRIGVWRLSPKTPELGR